MFRSFFYGFLFLLPLYLLAHVKDDGHFFTQSTIEELEQTLKRIHQLTKKSISINTKDTFEADKPSLKKYFNLSVDQSAQILITKNPRKFFIYVDDSTQKAISKDFFKQVRQDAIHDFSKHQYDEGILKLAHTLEQKFIRIFSPSEPQAQDTNAQFLTILKYLGFGFLIIAFFMILKNLFRTRHANRHPSHPLNPTESSYPQQAQPQPSSSPFLKGMLGGIVGAAAGSWLYDKLASPSALASDHEPLGGKTIAESESSNGFLYDSPDDHDWSGGDDNDF